MNDLLIMIGIWCGMGEEDTSWKHNVECKRAFIQCLKTESYDHEYMQTFEICSDKTRPLIEKPHE
jgi:hypothetical protein